MTTTVLSRGFTLVELMIVVVIVAVLAMLAVVGYRKLIQTSHVTEATGMVQNIRVAQESYHSETQQYATVSSTLTDYYPSGAPKYGQVFAWGGAPADTPSGGVSWLSLPVHVDGPVLFGYASMAGAAGTTPNGGTSIQLDGTATLSFSGASPTDWYIIAAEGDLDGIATGPSNDTMVYGASMTNQIFVVNEGM